MATVIPILSLKSGRIKYKQNSKAEVANNAGGSAAYRVQPTTGEDSSAAVDSCNERSPPSLVLDDPSVQKKIEQKPIGAGGAPDIVRKVLEYEKEEVNSDCQLIHEENTARIYFKFPDQKASEMQGRRVYYVLQCAEISAGDLKVTTKFGSWDSMVARILIECNGPIFLWKHKDDTKRCENAEKEYPAAKEYEFKILNSCMVKATFSVEFVSMVCKLMHLVKVAKTREILKVKDLQRTGIITKQTKIPSKIREGLPEWVNYIPYRWYSANLRRIIEYVLVLYTILSLLWAVWQLYRHVNFIQEYLKPIVIFIEHYFSILKSWFQYLDSLFTVLSHYWWNYIKPLFMILVAAFSPLFQIFRPLKGIINIIPHLFEPFIQFFHMIYIFIKPVFLPLKSLLGLCIQSVFAVFNNLMMSVMGNPTIAYIIHRSQELYIVQLIHEALHGHLDPLKAQVVVVRDLIFKSSRKIYYGLRFIVSKTYFMVLFLRREREYSEEGKNLERETKEEAFKQKVD